MPLKVLIVDDATFVRDMVKRAMRQIVPDAELYDAVDGTRAVALIKQKTPDLILSDWEMPEMSGDQLLKWLRSQPEFTSTPFIMITSRGDRNHVLEAVNAGVSDYISKPFTAEELHRKIHKQLKRIGFQPKTAASTSSGGAFSSIAVLTGGAADPTSQPRPAASPVVQAASLFAKPTSEPKPAAKNGGKASLRFAEAAYSCEVREISLQAMNCILERPEVMPALFDQAAVDLENATGEVVARLNAYVHSLAALSQTPDSTQIRVTVRFVDQDPAKMEVLSRMIGNG